ncbi:hypothetical protein SE16_08280 [Ardenticatena maritima]|uniref:Fibronectin type III-like domain-containing protein n=2 Tax=Ardenticatena maritima TaxID=872965 RepID=A0A0P6XT81_9CHLR|nr:hypothetical protein SE16_08280 [Ardenticatena maritima]
MLAHSFRNQPSQGAPMVISELLNRMTLDEKIAQLGAVWAHEVQDGRAFSHAKARTLIPHGIGQITRIGGDTTLEPPAAARFANAIQRYLVEETRLGIPAIVHEETCAGLMSLGSTAFPQMLGVAATWMPDLAEAMTRVIREQARAVGAHQALAPVLDLALDPRWGRCEETFGEDPLLASHFGMAYVRGLQGNDLRTGILATGKHFIGHSLSEGGLNCNPVHMGWNDIWNVLMMPFQAVVQETNIAAIMNAYPEIDGEVVAASRRLLTQVLREQLGFNGIVVSDYEAITMLNSFHFVAANEIEAALLALQAGIDMELPTRRCYGDALKTALEQGRLSMETLDTAVERVLRMKEALGLFDNPYVDEGAVHLHFETPAQRQLARTIAAKSLTLLKNDANLLPLSEHVRTLAVIGPNADAPRAHLGDYSYAAVIELLRFAPMPGLGFGADDFDAEHVRRHAVAVPSVLESIRAVVPHADVLYTPGCRLTTPIEHGIEEAVRLAQQAEVAVVVLGDRSGLTPDATSGETRDSSTLRLPAVQEELLRAVAATGTPVVLVLLSGRVPALSAIEPLAQAILEAWIPGEEGGPAIADALFGRVVPGGKLPVSFPRSVGQLPVYYYRKPSGGRSHWYGDYLTEPTTPLYPFGHGLSYTTFEYDQFAVWPKQATLDETVHVQIRVRNSGDVAADEVVQLYSRDRFASSPRPVKELKAFARLTLAPGEARTLRFHLPVAMFAFYDVALDLVVEPGTIEIMVGASSADIRARGVFEIVGERTRLARRSFAWRVETVAE